MLNSMHTVLWSVSIVLHTSLHASQELPVPEHDAVLPEAGVVRLFGISIPESAYINGDVTLTNVIMVFECERFWDFGCQVRI